MYEDKMVSAEYIRYIGYQRHLLTSIRRTLRDHEIAEFEKLPLDYERLACLHDDLERFKHSPHALAQWRLVRNENR